MTVRLPIPGFDDGTWGDILNSFLEVSLASNGTINSGVVGNTQLDTPTQTAIASVSSKYSKPVGGIPKSDLASSVQTSLSSADSSVQTSQLGAASGVATLNGSSQVTSSQLPSSLTNGSQQTIQFARSGSLFVVTGAGRFVLPFAGTIVNVVASVGTAPTGASVICDVKKNGTTVFTTQANRPTIAASSNVSNTAVPDLTSLSSGDYLTVDIDQVGSTIAGADLNVQVLWKAS